MAPVSGEADGSRFSSLARRAGLDRGQIRNVGRRREVAVAETQFPDDVPLWQVFDSHHPEQTLIHVPHIAARQTRNECQSFALNRYDR
jgi:hypothetical protein